VTSFLFLKKNKKINTLISEFSILEVVSIEGTSTVTPTVKS